MVSGRFVCIKPEEEIQVSHPSKLVADVRIFSLEDWCASSRFVRVKPEEEILELDPSKLAVHLCSLEDWYPSNWADSFVLNPKKKSQDTELDLSKMAVNVDVQVWSLEDWCPSNWIDSSVSNPKKTQSWTRRNRQSTQMSMFGALKTSVNLIGQIFPVRPCQTQIVNRRNWQSSLNSKPKIPRIEICQ